jgi:deoxycytidine triphosphate deaminase
VGGFIAYSTLVARLRRAISWGYRVTRRCRQATKTWQPAPAESVEYLEIPRDILAICVGKSTYAPCGIIVNVTPLEPEWRGRVTIEISNTTPQPAKIYAGEGIAQIVFLRAAGVCKTSYADKRGTYQDQKGLTLAFVHEADPSG